MNKILKSKNFVTIVGVILMLVILTVGYKLRIDQQIKLVDVYYAKETIQPKTKITEAMVAKASVPVSFILGKYYQNYGDIIGKYSNYNTMIAQGSIFYIDLLVEEKNLPDSMFYNLTVGERLVSFPVTMKSTYGNSIMPNSLVDVYVKLITTKGEIVYGEFMDNVNVLAVKDASGNNVFESTDSTRTPAFIYFALPEAKYLLHSALNYVAEEYSTYDIEVVLVPESMQYQSEGGTEVSSSYLYDFVLSQIKTIDSQKNLYDEILNSITNKQ